MAGSSMKLTTHLAASSAAALLLLGCGDAEEARLAIENAARELSVLNAGEGTRAPAAEARYEAAARLIQGVEGSEAQNAALAILDAQIKHGLAEPAALEAMRLEALAQARIAEAEAELRGWASHHARAASSSAFDPAPALAELDAREGDRRAQMEAERASSSALAQEIDAIRTEAEALRERANGIRARAAEALAQGQAMSPTAGLAAVQEAHELNRQADAIELDSERLTAEAARLEPTKTEHDVVAEKLQRQLAVLDEARRATRARQAELERESAEARALADDAAERLEQVLRASGSDPTAQGLIPLREGALRASLEEASNGFEASASAAGRARQHNRGGASLAIGRAQHALGGLRITEAEGYGAFAQLMERCAAMSPALPGQARYAESAKAAREAEAAAVAQAAEALQAAQDAFGGAGARGGAAEQLDRVNALLGRLALLAQDKDPGAAAYAQNPAGAAGDLGDGGGPGDDAAEAELAAAIDQALAAVLAGDGDALAAFVQPAGPAEEQLLAAVVPFLSASGRLDAATEAAFGQKFSAWGVENPQALGGMGMGGMGAGMAGGLDPAALADLSADQLDIRVQGDRGAVVLGEDAPTLEFIRTDGGWKMVFALSEIGLPPEASGMIGAMVPMIQGMGGVYDELVAEVQSGALRSNQAVAVAFTQKLQPLMQQMMGSMMNQGAPGGG